MKLNHLERDVGEISKKLNSLISTIVGDWSKLIILIIYVTLLNKSSIIYAQSWEQINLSFDTSSEHLLRKIKFVNKDTGWAFQYNPQASRIYKTTNGGYNWEVVLDTTYLLFSDIDFTDDRYGWICGYISNSAEAFVLRTVDYGNTWESLNINAPYIETLFFDTNLHGFAGGDSIYETFDGGNSWIGRNVTPYPSGYLNDMFFLDDSHAWAVCNGFALDAGSIIFSSNNGLTWEYLVDATYVSSSIFFKDTLNGLLAGGGGFSPSFIAITSDGGNNWDYTVLNSGPFYDMYFINDNLGWVVGGGGNLWVSDSSWNVWTQIDLGITDNLYSIQFVEDNTIGYISGANNTLLKYEIEVSVTDNQSLPNKIVFHQNFPNPFNPITTIRYELPIQTKVKLTIYNIMGQEVAVLLDKTQNAGRHKIMWNASNEPSGIYFYRLETPVRQITKKLVVLK